MHYLLPFIVLVLLLAHLLALHVLGSGAPAALGASALEADAFVVYYYKDTHSIWGTRDIGYLLVAISAPQMACF